MAILDEHPEMRALKLRITNAEERAEDAYRVAGQARDIARETNKKIDTLQERVVEEISASLETHFAAQTKAQSDFETRVVEAHHRQNAALSAIRTEVAQAVTTADDTGRVVALREQANAIRDKDMEIELLKKQHQIDTLRTQLAQSNEREALAASWKSSLWLKVAGGVIMLIIGAILVGFLWSLRNGGPP